MVLLFLMYLFFFFKDELKRRDINTFKNFAKIYEFFLELAMQKSLSIFMFG